MTSKRTSALYIHIAMVSPKSNHYWTTDARLKKAVQLFCRNLPGAIQMTFFSMILNVDIISREIMIVCVYSQLP